MNKSFILIIRNIFLVIMLCITSVSFANTNSMYCATKGGFIQLGMSMEQVIQACGEPINKSKILVPNMRKIKVIQLIYRISSMAGRDSYKYEFNPGGSTTFNLMITIVADKVSNISYNNANTNGASVCQNGPIAIGYTLAQVRQSCGDPDGINHSFQNIPQGNAPVKQETWSFKDGQYGKSFTLTFKNGILESI